MAEVITDVDLFCEDVGHEVVVGALLRRVAAECGVSVDIHTRSARGGVGRALTELKTWQRLRKGGVHFAPDLLVVALDANSKGVGARLKEVEKIVDRQYFLNVVCACPDPYIERWLLADEGAVHRVLDVSPGSAPDGASKARYKTHLRDVIERSGNLVLTTAVQDYGPELVEAMDLYRVSKLCPELGQFLTQTRAAFTRSGMPASQP